MTLTPTSTLVLIINNLHLHPSYYKTPCFIHFSTPFCFFLFAFLPVLSMWIRRGRPPLNLSPVRSSPSSLDQQVVSVPKEMVSSIRFEEVKEEKEPACLLYSPSQMETLEEGHGEKVINRKRSIMETCNHRDMYSPSAGACDLLALSLSASSQVLYDDEEVDKPIPFKKRITSYTKVEEEQIVNEEGKEERKGKAKARLTTLMSIENEEEEEEEEEAAKKKTKKTTKKKKRIGKKQKGLLLMEGSRCSRVNGRGWRCNQKTLVGYALCQHHLGMARIRSVNSSSGGTRDARIGGEDNGPRRQNLEEQGKGDISKEMEIYEEV